MLAIRHSRRVSKQRCTLFSVLQEFLVISITLIYVFRVHVKEVCGTYAVNIWVTQGPCILKTEFFRPWETSRWPSICCVSGPTRTLSGSPTFRHSPANMTLPSTSRKTRCGTCSPRRPSTTCSASIRTQPGSTPTSTKSSRWGAGLYLCNGAGKEGKRIMQMFTWHCIKDT